MRKVLLLSIVMALSALAFAQTETVSGHVTDEAGNPVPFASMNDGERE